MITLSVKKAPADFSPLFQAVEEELGTTERYSVELLFVGEKRIKDTNRAFRGVDRITDILSFPTTEVSAGDLPKRRGRQLVPRLAYGVQQAGKAAGKRIWS